MKNYVMDSFALLAFFKKEKNWKKVEDLLIKAHEEKVSLFISIINYGEIYYATLRSDGEEMKNQIMAALDGLPINIIDADKEITELAAAYKAMGGISYADCFAAALAKLKNAILVTGDTEFRQLESEIKIEWL